MKSLLDWHALYDDFVNITSQFSIHVSSAFLAVCHRYPLAGFQDTLGLSILYHIPNAALVWRLAIVREVIFSGFQLDLYSADEKPFAYWYAAQVIEAHLTCLDEMASVIPQGGFMSSLLD
jgi:N-alpha-acetyltransferase 35, NatC auxiliary subunit